jgi:NADPH:quinone reductase-like Zn-dependent oxidoreductase
VNAPGASPEYSDFAEPPAAGGRELVQLVAAGVHPIVRSLAAGRHYGSAGIWPMIPGVDAVARTSDGELVYTGYPVPPYGTLAEWISVPAGLRLRLPAGIDPVPVAAGLNPGLSSWLPLTARAHEVRELGTVLVLGGTGMAGLLAAQNARVLGAKRVVAAGRSEARLARAVDCGAAATALLTGDQDTDAGGIAAALDGTSPSLVLDFVWGPPAESAFRALGRRGLSEDDADIAYVQIGAMAGAEAAVPSSLLRSRRIRITGSGAGSAQLAEIMRQLPAYIQHIADGVITVPARVVPLSRVSAAWAAAQDGGDRVVVVPD